MPSDNFLESIINNSPSHVLVLDLDGTIKFINRTAGGRSKEEVLGQSVFSGLVEQEEIAKMKRCFAQVQTSKSPQLIEQQALSQAGIVRHWETRVSPIIDNEEVTGFILFSNDITTKKTILAEQATIFNLSSDFLGILKLDGFFSRVNPAFNQAIGYTEEEILNIPFIDLIHPDDRELTSKAINADISQAPHTFTLENRAVGVDGKVVRIEWRGNIDAKEIIVVGRDITAKRELEQQLHHAQKMEAIGQLAGGIAHDFNNLLMAISANAEMGQMCTNLEDAQRRLSDIDSASTRAAELTQKLLALSRNQPLQKKPLDLNYLIQNLQRKLELALPSTIKCSFEPAKKIPQITGDKGQIEQIIKNLCANAGDSMPEGGTILISTGCSPSLGKPNYVHVDITDSGLGIDDNIKEKIFNPFYTTKGASQRAGLGLSIVYALLKNTVVKLRF
jgi:PAS domain S-box-containing protein